MPTQRTPSSRTAKPRSRFFSWLRRPATAQRKPASCLPAGPKDLVQRLREAGL